MTMWRAVGILLISGLVCALGIFMVAAKAASGNVNGVINSRSSGARIGEDAATPQGAGRPSGPSGLSPGASRATVTAVVADITARAATASAQFTPVPSTPGASPGGPVAIGQSVEVGGSRYTVLQVVDPEPAGLFKPNPGNRRVALEISQESLGAALTYSYSFFGITDSSGKEFTAAITNMEPAFQTGRLEAGQVRTGWVTLQLPASAELGNLTVNVAGKRVPIVALR